MEMRKQILSKVLEECGSFTDLIERDNYTKKDLETYLDSLQYEAMKALEKVEELN